MESITPSVFNPPLLAHCARSGRRLVRWIRVIAGLWLLCDLVPAMAQIHATAGVTSYSEGATLWWFWLGGGLVLLGLIGAPLVILFNKRQQFAEERQQIQANFDAMQQYQRQLETELQQWRQTGPYQQQLEAELHQWRQTDAERQQQLAADLSQSQRELETLRGEEQRSRLLIQNLPAGVFMLDLQGNCLYVNECWRRMVGLTHEQIMGRPMLQVVHPEDRDALLNRWQEAVKTSNEFITDHRFCSSSGRITWVNTRAAPVQDRTGRPVYYLGTSADIANLKASEETLRASEARFRSYFELPLVGIGLTGADKRWWEVNERLCEMLGYRRTQLLSLNWPELTHPDDLTAELAQFDRLVNQRIKGYSLDKRFLRQDGTLLYASVSTGCVRRPNGVVDYFVTVVQDISERRRAEEQLHRLSRHDTLTGLPNRTLLSDRLQQAVVRAMLNHTQVGVLLVDLDHFKRINDTLGHSVGDQVVREAAARLQRCIRENDTISRQGGDEFVILLPDLTVNDEADRIAQRVLEAMGEPFRLEDHELHISCSIGVSLSPRDGHTAENLLKNADNAMYRAKDLGRNNYQHYQSGATQLARERLILETSLRHAVKREQMEMYYQPKWDFRSQSITGAEALIRWNHPDRGLLPPARFIPIAEDSDLILTLGEWALRAAVREVGQLHQAGWPGFRVAVNLSGRQFRQEGLTALIRNILEQAGFAPECLELELTETILMHHTEDNLAALRAFKSMGVRLAIDDFGTGYSSLGYLQRFPVDVLKIDRSFVTDLPQSDSNIAIVDAIVTLAHGLDLEVVAEGIETIEHAEFLREHGCDEGQGYYYGKPMPMPRFLALLERDRARVQAAATAPGVPSAPGPDSTPA